MKTDSGNKAGMEFILQMMGSHGIVVLSGGSNVIRLPFLILHLR